ncbi:hypothetical protein HDZ31DRAFT_63383 [Schizophyllum fasciatum]
MSYRFSPMMRRVLVWLLFCATAATQRTTGSCNQWMCINATLEGTAIRYALTNLEEPLGWMAVGWGDRMPQTHMAVLWPNKDGTVTLSQRFARGHMEPRLESRPPRVASAPEISPSWLGTTTLSFLAGPPTSNPNSDSGASFLTPGIIAFSPYAPASSDPSAHIYAHTGTGYIHLSLSAEDEDNATKNPDPAHNSAQAAASDANCLSSARLLALHGALMTLAFGLLLPLGALTARLARTRTRRWIVAHKALQAYAGAPAILLGLAAAVAGVGTRGVRHVHDAHQAGGVLLVGVYALQVAVGAYIHGRAKAVPHPVRNVAHVVLGLTVVGLGLGQLRSGLHEWDSHMPGMPLRRSAYAVHAVWAGFCIFAYLAGLCLLPRQFAQEKSKTEQKQVAHKEYFVLENDVDTADDIRPSNDGEMARPRRSIEQGNAIFGNEEVHIPLLRNATG